MAKSKTGDPTWSDVKSELTGLDQKNLIKLIGDLYRFSKENKAFLHARFAVGKDLLAPYKKTIETSMYPDMYANKPVQISKAKKAISNYSKAVGDPLGGIELMIFFVECGIDCTVKFGDMDGRFYDALIGMYQQVIQKVLSLPEKQQGVYKRQLEKIQASVPGTGSGYYDIISEEYYIAFSEDK